MLKQLRWKFVAITTALTTALLLVVLALVLYFSQVSLAQESIQRLQSGEGFDFRPGRPGEGRGGAVFSMLVTHQGELVVSGSGYFDLSDEDYLLKLAQEALMSSKSTGILRHYRLRYLRENTTLGIRLRFVDISHEQRTLENLAWGCLGLGLAGILGFFLLSLLLARWAVRPVEKAWQAQKEFVADASHELKTPLTVITTNAELLTQEGTDETQLRSNILTMAQQMRTLVEGLLELARLDNASLALNFQEVALSSLVSQTCLVFEPLAFEQALLLESFVAPDIRVSGSESYLRQLLEILLDNALKYSQTPGSIRVYLSSQRDTCRLTVENPGTPIPKEEQEKLFRRFYRVNKARTGGSFGLGLSIAQNLVHAHKGQIWVESGNGVNRFIVQLPLA